MLTSREHPVLSSGFGDSNHPRISWIHVSFWIFKLLISDIQILILHLTVLLFATLKKYLNTATNLFEHFIFIQQK